MAVTDYTVSPDQTVSLDVPTSWQALSDKDPSQADPITRAVITAINNMLIDLMAAMSHKDWRHHLLTYR